MITFLLFPSALFYFILFYLFIYLVTYVIYIIRHQAGSWPGLFSHSVGMDIHHFPRVGIYDLLSCGKRKGLAHIFSSPFLRI
jgi:hypothetical protein